MRHSSIETNVNTLYKELKNDEKIQESFKVFIVYNINILNKNCFLTIHIVLFTEGY